MVINPLYFSNFLQVSNKSGHGKANYDVIKHKTGKDALASFPD